MSGKNYKNLGCMLSTCFAFTKSKVFRTVYRKVASSNMSSLEAHAGFFRLLMKGIFVLYVV